MVINHYTTGLLVSVFDDMSNTSTLPVVITGAQPKAGTGHKMQSVPVVFERYIVRDISLTSFWECSLAHWNLIRYFEKHEVAFGGTTFTMD